MNPTYAEKEIRDLLGDKSKKVFGARGKWKKLCHTTGITLEKIEEFMDKQIELLEKGELSESSRSSKNIKYNRKTRRAIKRSKKARSRKAQDGVTTTKGSAGSV